MANLKGNIAFTGSVGGLSAYTRKGSEKIILRTKGGASKDKIKRSAAFTNTRKLNAEFGGASTTARNIKLAMTGLTHLDHSNFQSRLTGVCSRIQKLDTTNDWGRRVVLISRYRQLLEGFNLEMGTGFNSIIKHPLQCSINRNELSATVLVPQLFPHISVYVPGRFSLFRLIAVLGVVPDMQYDESLKQYVPVNKKVLLRRADVYTAWLSTEEICPQQMLSLQMQGDARMSDDDSLLLTVGVEFGIAVRADVIEPVNYAGAARIMMLV